MMKYALGLGTGLVIFASIVSGAILGVCASNAVLAMYPEYAVDFANDYFGGHLVYRKLDKTDSVTED